MRITARLLNLVVAGLWFTVWTRLLLSDVAPVTIVLSGCAWLWLLSALSLVFDSRIAWWSSLVFAAASMLTSAEVVVLNIIVGPLVIREPPVSGLPLPLTSLLL